MGCCYSYTTIVIATLLLFTVRARSLCVICQCDLFLLTLGSIGAGEVVEVAQCEHCHWVLYNPFVVIRWITVAIEKKNAQCERALKAVHVVTGCWFHKYQRFLCVTRLRLSKRLMLIVFLLKACINLWFLKQKCDRNRCESSSLHGSYEFLMHNFRWLIQI